MSNISENIPCTKNVVSYTITNIQALANQVKSQKTSTEHLMWLNSFSIALNQGISGIKSVVPTGCKEYWLYNTMVIKPLEEMHLKTKAIAKGLSDGKKNAIVEYSVVLTALATMDEIIESI